MGTSYHCFIVLYSLVVVYYNWFVLDPRLFIISVGIFLLVKLLQLVHETGAGIPLVLALLDGLVRFNSWRLAGLLLI